MGKMAVCHMLRIWLEGRETARKNNCDLSTAVHSELNLNCVLLLEAIICPLLRAVFGFLYDE